MALETEQSLLVPGLDQLVDHRGRGGEADRQALLTGRQPQSESNVSLSGAAVADRDRVLAASNVFAAGEFQDQCLVERGDRGEVETVAQELPARRSAGLVAVAARGSLLYTTRTSCIVPAPRQ